MEDKLLNVDKIVQSFIDKYGEEELYTKNLQFKVSNWLNNTEDLEVRMILLDLFSDFKFYTKIEIKDILYKQLMTSLEKVNINTTNILPLTSQDGRSNSSFDIIHLLKEIDREHDVNLYRDTIKTDFIHIERDINNIIVFDDISGTGRTVIEFLKHNHKIMVGKNIHLNLISITEIAKINIEGYLKQHSEINVELVYEHLYEKIFINHPRLNEIHQTTLSQFEKSIWGKENNILGYKDSQLLIGFSHNIPNNTISSFWYHTDFRGEIKEWNCLFKRYTKKKRPNQNRRIAKNRRSY